MMFSCRSCGEYDLLPVLSFGQIPLANALLKREQLGLSEETFPLDLVFCLKCTLLQITETVSPKKLFSKYFYFSSFSETVLKNAHEIAHRLTQLRGLNKDSLVVEIASNDGYLLKNYKELMIPVLGVEPAHNIAQVAKERGVPTLCEFFDEKLASKLRTKGQQADVIHANNVIAHVADLHGVLKGMATLLKPDGLAVVENHYAKDLIDHVEFDSIYHEHLCYFSATSFRNLFEHHGLRMVDIEHLAVHGGSLRAYFQRVDGPCSLAKDGANHVRGILNEEFHSGMANYDYYQDFGGKVQLLRRELSSLLRSIKADGKHIAAYGASAKGTTLLNYFGIDGNTIDFVVDRSTVKQNYYTPGTHLPIRSPADLLTYQPDYLLLLTWNFADEILTQQAEFRARGGKFIIPIPELKVI